MLDSIDVGDFFSKFMCEENSSKKKHSFEFTETHKIRNVFQFNGVFPQQIQWHEYL